MELSGSHDYLFVNPCPLFSHPPFLVKRKSEVSGRNKKIMILENSTLLERIPGPPWNLASFVFPFKELQQERRLGHVLFYSQVLLRCNQPAHPGLSDAIYNLPLKLLARLTIFRNFV